MATGGGRGGVLLIYLRENIKKILSESIRLILNNLVQMVLWWFASSKIAQINFIQSKTRGLGQFYLCTVSIGKTKNLHVKSYWAELEIIWHNGP